MFEPKHYSFENWVEYTKKGFRVNRFLARPSNMVDRMTAAEFLRAGWGEVLESLDGKAESCCLASIVLPQKAGIIRLKCDEDYFGIVSQKGSEIKNLAQWQLAKCFEGFRLDELWTNMVELQILSKKSEFMEKQLPKPIR